MTFNPSGRRGEVPIGTTVLDAARRLGVDLDSVCGGRGLCGRCQVSVGAKPGVPADPSRLGPPTSTEQAYHGRRPLPPDRRLGCAARVHDHVVVAVPPDSQVHRQVVRKEVGDQPLQLDPVVDLRFIEVPPVALDDRDGEAQRLAAALADTWGLDGVRCNRHALAELGPALEEGRRAVTVAMRGQDVVAVWPGLRTTVHGVAVDIGSTTVAGHLVELTTGAVLASAGLMNPQITYGEDLMSRVSYAMLDDDGGEQLTTAVRSALQDLLGVLCDRAGVDRREVLELVLVGNPIMHHLALGLDARPLGAAPFPLATTAALTVPASELDVTVHPAACAYVPPCVAGHVGADAMAMILAERPDTREELTLLVDVGTNAEIVLGDHNGILAASSPTGPAFEGAQISGGQRAAPGAIERVRVDPDTLEPRYRVIGTDRWSHEWTDDSAPVVTGICGSGIIEAIGELFLAGIISRDGQLASPPDRPVERIVADGRTWAYRLVDAHPDRGQAEIRITQNDVRAIQLAKAALHAGCRLLMDHRGVDHVDRIRLAGAFGSHIDPRYALLLGLVPDCDPAQVTAAGNAAGTGALQALLSGAARGDVEHLAARVTKVETATEPAFQEHFVAAMGLPHATDPYTRLAAHVPLPAVGASTSSRATSRRRRRR